MNRGDLAWALGAVLPHVGTTKGQYVGMRARGGWLYVYATDHYSAGVARIPLGAERAHLRNLYTDMSKSEAQDLMRFVRPTKKAHDDECLTVLVSGDNGDELHVGTAEDSAVFDLATDTQPVTLDLLLGLIERITNLPIETTGIIQQPSLPAKFAKAQRYETDRLCLYPFTQCERPDRPSYGVAVVTVGKHFVGTVAGLTHEAPLDLSVIESFLNEAKETREARTL